MQKITREHIDGAKSGNAKDIEFIFNAFKPAVSACAAKLRNSNFDYEDAVQEGNIGLFKAILSYRENADANFSTYAKTCILNSMLSARDAANAQKHRVLSNALPLDESILLQGFEADFIAREQIKEFIGIAKQKLSEFEFLVFSLHTMGYSYKDIADIAGKDVKSVNNAIQRIHAKLRK